MHVCYLDHNAAFIIAKADVVGSLERADAPHTIEAVVEGVLEAVGVSVPHPHGAVLGARQDDWQLGMEIN